MKRDDEDYTHMERDFDEFIRRGLAEREWERVNDKRDNHE